MQRPRRKTTPNFAGGCAQLMEEPCELQDVFLSPEVLAARPQWPRRSSLFPGSCWLEAPESGTNCARLKHRPNLIPSAHYPPVGKVPKHRKAAPPHEEDPSTQQNEKDHKRGPLLSTTQYFYTSRWFLPSQICSQDPSTNAPFLPSLTPSARPETSLPLQ